MSSSERAAFRETLRMKSFTGGGFFPVRLVGNTSPFHLEHPRCRLSVIARAPGRQMAPSFGERGPEHCSTFIIISNLATILS